MEIVILTKKHVNDVIVLLQSLSNFNPKKDLLEEIWNSFSGQKNVHSVVALHNKQVVGYGSIILELKIRGGKMGHIEDIVTHPDFRNMGIGKRIMKKLYSIAQSNECYKIALQCKEDNIKFYENCGYKVSGFSMQVFLK